MLKYLSKNGRSSETQTNSRHDNARVANVHADAKNKFYIILQQIRTRTRMITLVWRETPPGSRSRTTAMPMPKINFISYCNFFNFFVEYY